MRSPHSAPARRRIRRRIWWPTALLIAGLSLSGCAATDIRSADPAPGRTAGSWSVSPSNPSVSSPAPKATNPTTSPTTSPTRSPSASTGPTSTGPTSTGPTSTGTSSADSSAARCRRPPTLSGADHHAYAFASLDRPDRIVSVGRVADRRAWSTSKVLVVAAYLDTRVDGNPDKISSADRRLITAALSRSDGEAITAIRDRIVGRPGPAMTRILRSVGDDLTTAPDSYQGEMTWSLAQQVRFAAALARGRVVSAPASRFLLGQMHPIERHAWGLGTVGADSYKGGWLRADTATRQFGLLDGYAVAISTDSGPVVRQSDGDSAHVREINRVAADLGTRLGWQKSCGQ